VGKLAPAVVSRGGKPRRRALDLVIAATGNVQGTLLLTSSPKDFALITDLVDAQAGALTTRGLRASDFLCRRLLSD
jgi:predicted nucleic acid-binding protein